MPPDRGIFLPVTWRMSPALTLFTSEMFYKGELKAREGLERQVIEAGSLSGSRLWLVPVEHEGCQSASDEEVTAVVAPFNAQVNRITEKVGPVPVGTVDKFQGQTCAVFLVASPRLFGPECRTPRRMQLANALCRYREMAAVANG